MNSDSFELTVAEHLVTEDALGALDEQYPIEGFFSEGNQWHIYFRDLPDVEKIASTLKLDANELKLTALPPKNWNALWESNFKEVVIDDFCRIYADFHPDSEGAFDYEIRINPKMSFGTGHHATTHMMIEHMRRLSITGKDVLDFGTGTAVLSILAAKMGAKSVVANDISVHAFENAQENANQNEVDGLELYHGGMEVLPVNGKYDLILANVNRSVLIREADKLLQLLKPGGELVISGILAVDEAQVLQHYGDKGARLKDRNEKNDWICVSFS
jgi:ribosomal protein L11 methyltransferase